MKKNQKKTPKHYSSWNPADCVAQPIGNSMTVFIFFFYYKQKCNFKAPADSKGSFGTRRLGSLDHLIMFNRSQSMHL